MNRSTRVRGIVRKRQITVGLSVIAMAVALVAVAALAKAPVPVGPEKVWVCHFPGHEAGVAWSGGSTTLDGDFVVAYQEGMPLPDQVSYDEAASLPVVYLTAWVALLDTAGLKAGETALVQSAGSGVGMAGVQIAKHVAGARVVTTAGSDEKVAKARALGADLAINYATQDLVAEVLRFTGGRGVDVALDMVGGEVFAQSQRALAEGGRLVSVGSSSGTPPQVDAALAERKRQTVVTGWGLPRQRTPEQAAQRWELVKKHPLNDKRLQAIDSYLLQIVDELRPSKKGK